MPNLYVTPTEIKNALPDVVRSATTDYDNILLQLANRVSRWIENYCNQSFYPLVDTRYYDGRGNNQLWIDPIISITGLEYSEDDGDSYAAVDENTDYVATRAGNHNSAKSHNLLIVHPNSTNIDIFVAGFLSIKIAGVWGYADDRDDCWEDSQDSVQDEAGINASVTSVTVSDADGADLMGFTPRFQAGQLIKIEDEYLEIASISTDTLTVVRGRNGSAAAEHAKDKTIYIWRPPEAVKQACIIQSARQWKRGMQGFSDAEANPELGQLFYLKALDPEVQSMLEVYRVRAVG